MRFESSVSTAVLTPQQIHPQFFAMQKKHPCPHTSNRGAKIPFKPLTDEEKWYRAKWVERQHSLLQRLPSTAVLGGTTHGA
jgi:hypothetical protein